MNLRIKLMRFFYFQQVIFLRDFYMFYLLPKIPLFTPFRISIEFGDFEQFLLKIRRLTLRIIDANFVRL